MNNNFNIKIKGKVISGKGEGKYYVGLKPYKEKFIEYLEFEPYNGTLNISINNQIVNFNNNHNIEIEDFNYNNKKYYGLKLKPVLIKDNKNKITIKGAVVVPKKTTHNKNILEIIAPVKLRNVLNLKDGDNINIYL